MKKLILILIFLLSITITAQNLSNYKLKNRLVLVLTPSIENPKYQKQIEKLQNHLEGLEERKIKVFQITPNQYSEDFTDNWKNKTLLYQTYKNDNPEFETILIGLDGGEKLHLEKPISAQQLFSVIDKMPMRKAEMRKN